jgi:hypothetical protein
MRILSPWVPMTSPVLGWTIRSIEHIFLTGKDYRFAGGSPIFPMNLHHFHYSTENLSPSGNGSFGGFLHPQAQLLAGLFVDDQGPRARINRPASPPDRPACPRHCEGAVPKQSSAIKQSGNSLIFYPLSILLVPCRVLLPLSAPPWLTA